MINCVLFVRAQRNLTEPYDFIYEKDDVPLPREKYSAYAPIMSFFVGKDFADVPFVTTDDWETATGRVYPPHGVDIRSEKNRKRNAVPWSERTPTAFFRGNATGPGTDARSNQRIRLARVSAAWKEDGSHGAGNGVDGVRYLDAGLVGWNFRDRKMQGQPMTFIKPKELGLPKADRVPMYAQMKYKYHVYVDGHCAAMRYASMMPLGAVILKVLSVTKADSMWYFPLLRPYDIHAAQPDPGGDHIPVAPDLSDLSEVITWCKQHDEVCERIASNSSALYERLIAKEGQIDYMQLVLHEIAARFHSNFARVAPTTERLPAAVAAFGLAPEGLADWFACGSREYTDTLIGVCTAPAPTITGLASRECRCPQCAAKRDAAAAELARAQASSSGSGARAGVGGGSTRSVGGGSGGGTGTRLSGLGDTLHAMRGSNAPKPTLVINDKIRALLEARRVA